MPTPESETPRAAVRETYGHIASGKTSTGCCSGIGCCGPMLGPPPTGSAIQLEQEPSTQDLIAPASICATKPVAEQSRG